MPHSLLVFLLFEMCLYEPEMSIGLDFDWTGSGL